MDEVHFGDWLIEPQLNRIRRGDQEQLLEPLTMSVLAYLVEHAGEVVSQEALLQHFWQGRVLEESTIHRRINQIRRALGDDAKHPLYIETISKRGYRAIASVSPVGDMRETDSADLLSALEAHTPPFPAYEGGERYVFVCYAHADRAVIYPELVRLRDAGVNVWYDEGISPGSEWTEELGNAINGCTQFLYYVSPASVAPSNCRDEVTFAHDLGKPMVTVHIEQTELPVGLRLSIGSTQALLKYEIPASDYQRKLSAALGGDEADRPVAKLAPSGNRQQNVRTSIAVLPFVNMSDDSSNEYFSEGISEDILNGLVRIPELFVIARKSSFQFKGENQDVREVGERLGVSHLLDGTVRKYGDKVRVTVQLIDAQTGRQLWSEQYNRELADVFSIQDEISAAIVQELELRLGDVTPPSTAVDAEAYGAYLLGRYAYDRLDLKAALEQFQQAVTIEPNYADAYVALAATHRECTSAGGEPMARHLPAIRASIEKALSLDPSHVEARASAAGISFYTDLEYQAGLDACHGALAREPSNDRLHRSYMGMLMTIGRLDVFLELSKHWIAVNPLDPMAHVQHAVALVTSPGGTPVSLGHTDRIEAARRVLRRAGVLGGAQGAAFASYFLAVGLGDVDELPRIEGLPPALTKVALAHYHYAIGDAERSRELARELVAEANLRGILESEMWMLLGEPQRAVAVYEQALDEGAKTAFMFARQPPPLGFNLPSPDFRQEPEFQHLLRKVKLDDESVRKLRVQPLPF